MQQDMAIGGVLVVAVGLPMNGQEIDFDIAGRGRVIGKLEHGLAEVRTGLAVAKAGMKNAHGSAVQRQQLIAPETLMLPDGVEEAFGRGTGRRRGWRRGFGQSGRGERIAAPIRV
jgi:hypothetical protein